MFVFKFSGRERGMDEDEPSFVSFRPTRQDRLPQDLETPRVSVVPMSNRYATQTPTDSNRLQKFMGQIGGGNNLPQQQQQQVDESNYSENAGGRFVGNRIVVDDVNQRFVNKDMMHLSKAIPPGAATPTTTELAEAWNYANDVRELQDNFYTDPLVQFITMVEGYLNRGASKRGEKQTMKVADLYSMLAAGNTNSNSNRFHYGNNNGGGGRGGIVNTAPFGRPNNLQTFRVSVPDNTGFENTAVARSPIDVQRTLDDSEESPDQPFHRLRRDRRTETTEDINNYFSSPIFTPQRQPQQSTPLNPRRTQANVNTPTSSIPSRTFPRTPAIVPTQLFSSSNARSFNDYSEPSGPRNEGPRSLMTLPDDLSNNQVIAPPDPNNNNNNTQPQLPQQRQQPQQSQPQPPQQLPNANLVGLSQDPRYTQSVNKYLSNVRTLDAYRFISRPEITGDITVSNTVLACIRFAYKRLLSKYPRNFVGATLLDFATGSLMEEFAYYVHFWCLDVKITSMDVVPLNSAEARNLDKRCAYEEVLGEYYWDKGRQDFIRNANSHKYSPYQQQQQYQTGAELIDAKLLSGNAFYIY